MDRILLEGMAFVGHHGVLEAERELGVRLVVDVELETDLRAAGASDRLEDTIDYTLAHRLVGEVVRGEPCHLLETVAERIAARLLTLAGVGRVTVRVRKRPPLEAELRSLGVEVSRSR
jgi:dihydroneopterin aldolase